MFAERGREKDTKKGGRYSICIPANMPKKGAKGRERERERGRGRDTQRVGGLPPDNVFNDVGNEHVLTDEVFEHVKVLESVSTPHGVQLAGP